VTTTRNPVQQVITVVTLGSRRSPQYGHGAATASFSATSGTPVLVFVSYRRVTTRTCALKWCVFGISPRLDTSPGITRAVVSLIVPIGVAGYAGVITAFHGHWHVYQGTIQIVSVPDARCTYNSAYNSGNSTALFKLGATPDLIARVLFGTANFPTRHA